MNVKKVISLITLSMALIIPNAAVATPLSSYEPQLV